jgi:hypothetical protein
MAAFGHIIAAFGRPNDDWAQVTLGDLRDI